MMDIGIDGAARYNLLGSLVVAIVVVDKVKWRRFASLPIRDSDNLSRIQRDKIVALTQKHLEHLFVYKIHPKDIKEDNRNDLEAQAMTECLNTYKDFWKQNIYIANFDRSRGKFLNRVAQFLPKSLKDKNLNFNKWVIENNCDEKHRPCALASIYAQHYSDLEYDDIKRVYGETGNGLATDPKTKEFMDKNKDNPHLRR